MDNNKILKSVIDACCRELKKTKNKQIISDNLYDPLIDIIMSYTYPYIITHLIILGVIVIGIILIITLLIFNK